MTFKTRFTTALATGAILVNALAPIAMANTVTVSGNGVNSTNGVNVTNSSNTVVNQTNDANITNHVSSNASTGGNSSNFNTGGNTTINTGSATNNVNVTSAANLNQASLSNCASCNGSATNVTVSGNGVGSDNGVAVNNGNNVFLNQNNQANFNNKVNADSNTGKNDTSYNTGGDSVILTGNAKTNVTVGNMANANVAQLGGSNGTAGSSSVIIKDNGVGSNNGVTLNHDSAVVLSQDNNANIKNDVDANAKTGWNQSQFNTGGFTGISTGNATTDVAVDNMANFNAASLDCGCVLDGTDVKVAGNGVGSDNGVDVSSDNAVFNDQANNARLHNDVNGDAKSGSNDLGFSTGDVMGDPVIYTGNAKSSTDVNNSGNVNVLDNGGNTLHLPGNWEVGTSFDLGGLWTLLHGWMA